MKIGVYKVTLLVIDTEGIGAKAIKEHIENTKHVQPIVMGLETRTVDWSDDHPLNKSATCEAEFRRLFGGEQ